MSHFESARERVVVRETDCAMVEKLAAELNISSSIAAILVGRNYTTFDSCKTFFRPQLSHFHDPFIFKNMEVAVNRICSAIRNKEKIVVYGDYDVDGITSTALMIRVLQKLGAQCDYFLPNRLSDGYGISKDGIRKIADGGATLIVSVDCGITSISETEYAGSLNVDMIITDHHEPKEKLPSAVAILDPKIPGCSYPDKNLAGVGVALKLCQALGINTGLKEELWLPCLDLVALGTAADIVALTGENRIITRFGFDILAHSSNVGIKELVAQQKLTGKKITTSQVVFQLAPCINAVGRLGDPGRGVELLLTNKQEVALQYARELRDTNLERRALDSSVAQEAISWVYQNCSPETDYSLVLGNEHWHLGVIGIVASKMVERFHRPSILFSVGSDGFARGSGRSIPALHLLSALEKCSDILESFGGHAAAAGMKVKNDKLDQFRQRFNEIVKTVLKPDDLTPVITADAEVELPQITPKFFRILKQMEPFGPGNMRPVLMCRNLQHRYSPRKVGNNHLKMAVTGGGIVMDAIAFNFGERFEEVRNAESLAMAFSLEENEWNGSRSLQLKVKGMSV